MSATWHDSGLPSFLGIAPRLSFWERPEVYAEAPAAYQAAMEDIRVREMILGREWFQRNADLAHRLWEMKRPWWLV